MRFILFLFKKPCWGIQRRPRDKLKALVVLLYVVSLFWLYPHLKHGMSTPPPETAAACSGRPLTVFVMDFVHYHKEVQASLVFLSNLLGATEIYVSRDISGTEKDAESLLYKRQGTWKWVAARNIPEAIRRVKTGRVVLFMTTPEVRTSLFLPALETLSHADVPTAAFFYCHNPDRCVESLNVFPPTLRDETNFLVPTRTMARYLHDRYNMSSTPWIPVFETGSRESCVDKYLLNTITVPGMVNYSKRPFDILLPHTVVTPAVGIEILGECSVEADCTRIKRLASFARSKGIYMTHALGFLPGRILFPRFLELMQRSKFLLGLTDELSDFMPDYLVRGKLTSSFAMAMSFEVPILSWCPLLREYSFLSPGKTSYACYPTGAQAIDTLRRMRTLSLSSYCSHVGEIKSAKKIAVNRALHQMSALMGCEKYH